MARLVLDHLDGIFISTPLEISQIRILSSARQPPNCGIRLLEPEQHSQ